MNDLAPPHDLSDEGLLLARVLVDGEIDPAGALELVAELGEVVGTHAAAGSTSSAVDDPESTP